MPQTFQNIEKLVKWLNKGNKQAFNELFSIYHHKLFLYAFRILKSRELADEVVQEAFIKVWEYRNAINPKQSFDAYLFRVGKNLIVDHFRKLSRQEHFIADLTATVSLFYNHTENQVIYNDLAKFTESAINQLPTQRQRIFRLSREEGKSHEEIADQLGISKNTVKVNIFKSLKSIRSYLVKNADYTVPPIIFLFLL